VADVNNAQLPEEGVYKPKQIWERPVRHVVKGVNAFELCCHVNSFNELAAVVIGNSGVAPTLISYDFLKSLTAWKPKLRTRNKLKLLQLMGSAGCSKYVKLDLYF
jgi:hypothetical protein